MSLLEAPIERLRHFQPMRVAGRVAALRGLTALVDELPLPVGSLVSIGEPNAAGRLAAAPAGASARAGSALLGEVIGFTRDHAIVMPLGGIVGIRAGDVVVGLTSAPTVGVSERLLGRVVDGLGRPIDGRPAPEGLAACPLSPPPIPPMRRRRIAEPLHTGVRAIDLFTTVGRGQRIGVFAGPGVGKSTLLGQIARHASSDVNVIALIGERGREVRDFIEEALGPEGLARSIVVAATGDESPLLRIRAALAACAAAEHFRDRGLHVLLMMDSVTRFAHAQRQVGLSAGEPPATKGYTPSVFAAMAMLLERAGAVEATSTAPPNEGPGAASSTSPQPPAPLSPAPPSPESSSPEPSSPEPSSSEPSSPEPSSSEPSHSRPAGSITGLYTILVEGDDLTEPVADAARGILDGHIVLSRRLAQRGHFPAIDVLDSVSRVADDVSDPTHIAARRQAVRLLAAYREVEDLLQIGAYAHGSNPEADVAIAYQPRLRELLCQERNDRHPFEEARALLIKVAMESGDALARRAKEGGR